jgi:hypothetical protein
MSEMEATRRQIGGVGTSTDRLEEGFFNKLTSDLLKAKAQMLASPGVTRLEPGPLGTPASESDRRFVRHDFRLHDGAPAELPKAHPVAQRCRMAADDPIGIGSGRREELCTLVPDTVIAQSDPARSGVG